MGRKGVVVVGRNDHEFALSGETCFRNRGGTMKTTTVFRWAVQAVAALAIAGASAGEPSIGQVSVRQRWPWSRLVDIDYVLSCDSTQRVDVAVKAYDGDTPLHLPASSFAGDIYEVGRGPHRMVWDPTATCCTNSGVLTNFRVTLTPVRPPVYLIVNLDRSLNDSRLFEYVYPDDSRLVTDKRGGRVWYGVTNDAAYMTTKLVLRRISPGTFEMGSPPDEIGRETLGFCFEDRHKVVLTRPFYIGVFEVTQEQWRRVMGSEWTSCFTNVQYAATRPVDSMSYDAVRGTDLGTRWPAGNEVDATSFMGQLRAKTGLGTFDLPTEAQWEYACRAGTTTALYSGTDLVSPDFDTNLCALARYKFNGGEAGRSVTTEKGTARVGSYRPNAWGLYDMHGNLFEWCMDWYTGHLGFAPVKDPVGALSGSGRILRGGCYKHIAAYSRAAFRPAMPSSSCYFDYGFRVALPLP